MASSASRRRATVGVAASAVLLAGFPAVAAARQRSTPLPSSCPSTSVVAGALKEKITKVTSATVKGATGSKRTCVYANGTVAPTTIIFGTPVTAAAFAASETAASKGVAVASVHGLGNAAWVVKRGNGLSVLKGTLDIVI